MTTEISKAKANRLFWLGRYAERVYLSLHFLRKHFDMMIDQDSNSYVVFCQKMGIQNRYTSREQFMSSYLYDEKNPDSLINMLESVNDNAILVREEIFSETLSYVQMSINYIKSAKSEMKILSELQPITDYILAFWGSIDERISFLEVRHIIKIGKFVESADLHLRFGYPFDRIERISIRLFDTIKETPEVCDVRKVQEYQSLLTPEKYQDRQLLNDINELFSA